MKNNDEILALFENYLAQMQLPEEPQLLYHPIIYAMSAGGKRIRPTLLMLCCEAFGGDVREAMSAAAAVEMFHNFTLLHDDIMDNNSFHLRFYLDSFLSETPKILSAHQKMDFQTTTMLQ